MRQVIGVGLVSVLVGLGGVAPVAAQEAPHVEVSGGWNLIGFDPFDSGTTETYPMGWYVDVAGNLNRIVGLVGQVTGNYKSFDDLEFVGVTVDTSAHTFMGGVRFNGRGTLATGFGQVLVGGARGSASVGVPLLGTSLTESSTDLAVQVGGGINVMPGPVGVRFGADYIRVFADGEGTNVFRVAVGIVFGL